MKSSLALRLVSLCLLFGLLLGIPLSSVNASEVIQPTNEDVRLLLDEWEPSNPYDYTDGLRDYIESFAPSTFGIVNDDTGTVSYSIRYYGGIGYGDNWVSETNWTTGSNIQINKVFALSDMLDFFSTRAFPTYSSRNEIIPNYFSPCIGYTLTFNREDGSILSKGSKINFDLSFSDKVVDIARMEFPLSTDGDGEQRYITKVSRYANPTNLYSNFNSVDNMVELIPPSTSNASWVAGYSNIVTFYGHTVSGEDIQIAQYDDISFLNFDMKIPEDIAYIYIDVEYDCSNGITPSSTNLDTATLVNVPYVFNLALEGDIRIDDSGVTNGLIASIIEWLKSILNAIRELPDRIVNGIKNALQELFVPSPEFISGKFEEFKLLAENKLGFLFTMLDMVVDLFTTLSTNISDPMETLTIPSLILPFEHVDGGQIVLWQEMTFKVFPDGLDVLLNLVHLVTSIVIVTATINYAVFYVKRFFEKE